MGIWVIPAERSREGRRQVGLEGLASRSQSCLTPILRAWAEGLPHLRGGDTEPHVLPGPSAGSPPSKRASEGDAQGSVVTVPGLATAKSLRIDRCGLLGRGLPTPRPPFLAWSRCWGMGARCQASTGRARAGPWQLGSGRDTAGGPASVGTGWQLEQKWPKESQVALRLNAGEFIRFSKQLLRR